MKLYTFHQGRPRIGAELDGRLVDLGGANAARLGRPDAVLAASMIDLVRGWADRMALARRALGFAKERAGTADARAWTHELGAVKLLAPLPRPGRSSARASTTGATSTRSRGRSSSPTRASSPSSRAA